MARSSYIYLISDNDGPIAGFTVKYEMLAALKKLQSTTHRSYTVMRCRDGKLNKGTVCELGGIIHKTSAFEEYKINDEYNDS